MSYDQFEEFGTDIDTGVELTRQELEQRVAKLRAEVWRLRKPTEINNPVTRERYYNDARFRSIVGVMIQFLMDDMFTTQDIVRAAVLATQIYAERCSVPMTVILQESKP